MFEIRKTRTAAQEPEGRSRYPSTAARRSTAVSDMTVPFFPSATSFVR
ncbi:hypothetical protein ACL07V_04870 [Streptomyces sp. MB22_4]